MKAPFTVDYLNSIFDLRGDKLFWRINHYNSVRAKTRAGSIYQTGCPPHRIVKINGIRYSDRRIIHLMRTGEWVKRVGSKLWHQRTATIH